jgi:DNA-binding NarL/FixJ family response regulator
VRTPEEPWTNPGGSPGVVLDTVPHDARVRCTVLVVDDHPAFRAGLREMLAASRFEIVGEAHDAASALAAAEALHPELVLLDVMLPDRDGLAVAMDLARSESPPDVVLLSSRDALDFGTRLRSAAARGFIQKGDLSLATLEALLA